MEHSRQCGRPHLFHLHFFFCTIIILLLATEQDAVLEHQSRLPHIMVVDGNLRVAVPYNKNISFDTSGKGVVKIHGEDLVQIVQRAKEASTTIQHLSGGALMSLQQNVLTLTDIVQGNSGLTQRVALLEEANSNNSINSEAPGNLNTKIKALNSKVVRLTIQLRQLQALLKTNECISNPCRNGGTCEDGYNGFICRCPLNWEGTLCDSDVNECAHFAGTDLGCQNGATCINRPGTYECSCASGYFGVHCTRRSNDCSSASSRDLCGHGMCVDQPGTTRGYTCICDQGWTGDSSTQACIHDVDECTSSQPACSRSPPVPCINVPGSFYCGACPQGYNGNGYYCSDIDECQVNNGGCSMNPTVQCINTQGSRMCGSCPPGYQGDGITCTFQGVCQINNGGCHPLAQCIENRAIGTNYAQCICPAGYIGSGVGISGCIQGSAVQPSSSGTGGTVSNPCNPNPCIYGTCHLGSGNSYTCFCNSGFTGPTCAQQLDPCASSPCQHGGTCVREQASYHCRCTSDYTGTYCSEQQMNCGGLLNSEEGSLQFPHSGSTQQYPHGLSCAWVISTNSSKVLNLTFLSFRLESSPECNYDWLQIHDGRSAGEQMIGRFCGSTLPKNGSIISTHNVLYLWFRSDHSINNDGFNIRWTSIRPVCGGRINFNTSGTLSSPGSPGKYPKNRDCVWQFFAPYNNRIQFTFFTMMLENHSNCSYDFVEIRDGWTTRDRLLEMFCNTSHPEPITTSDNVALIRFHSDGQGSDSGFLLAYSPAPGTPGCGGVMTASSGTIISPNEGGDYYRHYMSCEWLIQFPKGERVQLTFTRFALEDSTACRFDYLEIHEGKTIVSPLAGRYCGTNIPRPYRSTGNAVLIVFRSDGSNSNTGFRIDYQELCGGVFSELTGVVKSPLYPNSYPSNKRCTYEIAVPMGRAITLEFQDFKLENNRRCFYDSLEIRDGHDSKAPLVGKYCGSNVAMPPTVVSTHNYLWLSFKSDSSRSYKGFYANYTTMDIVCGGISKANTGVIQSPNYPNTYGTNHLCRWTIVADIGKVVQLSWQSFQLESGYDCRFDYVEVYDNSSSVSDGGKIGRYCGGRAPPTITSIDNMLTIVFRSDFSLGGSFVASYVQIDTSHLCGGNYFTTKGVIRSPQYPNNYPHNKDCTWVITVPSGQQIMLNISFFQLERSYSDCTWDFLEIRNGALDTSPLIGKFCDTTIPRTIPSHGNGMYLRFKSDSSRSAKGFEISWDGTATGCGGTLTSPSGSIMSPNYPQSYGRDTECFWKIAVSKGSIVQVVFIHLDLETSPKCIFDYIAFYDGLDSSARQLGKYCSGSHPANVRSTGNHMFVKLLSDSSRSGTGFHIKYDAVCDTELRGFQGVIESPNFPNSYPSHVDCKWVIKATRGNKVNITFSHFHLEYRAYTQNCNDDYVQVSEAINDELTYTPLTEKLCGTTLPGMVHSNMNSVKIVMKSDYSVGYGGFRLEWVLDGCGGVFTHPEGEFTSPGYPERYPDDVQCEWTISLELGNSVQLTIVEFQMERTPDCRFDSLTIYGGPDENSPKLHKPLCQTIAAPIITTSSGNSMFIRFVSDFSYAGRGFKATYKTINSVCGGLFTAPHGNIHSHNYPHNYDPHDDCTWLIQVDLNHVVNFTFTDFDLERSNNCTWDYVKLYDGNTTESPILATLCGSHMPNITSYKSTGNTMTVRMKADGSNSLKGFSANYTIACGARIVTEDSGLISLLDSINANSDNVNCSWIIMGARPDDRVTLTFTHMDISPNWEMNGTCEYAHVEVRDGEDEAAPLLGSFCGSRIPPHITSQGSALFLKAVSYYYNHHGTFSASYSVALSACGGNLTSEHGAFTSPGYPNSYPLNTECVWTISTSPGNRAMITFRSFAMEQSEQCNKDYLEVRENDAIGRLIGVYCSNLPSNITAQQRLWLKFRSDGEGTEAGFVADYSLLHGNEMFGSSGQIASPLYPRPYIQSADYTWRITVSTRKVIVITFTDFFIETYHLECNYYLAIYDGYDATGVELYKGCGVQPPDPITSTNNVVFIHFRSDAVRHGSWFLLNWLEVMSESNILIPNFTPTTIPGCGGRVSLQPNNQNASFTEVTSPGFPNGYDRGLDCEWIIDTPPSYHTKLIIDVLDVESYGECYSDYIEVFQGTLGSPEWKSIKKLCHQDRSLDTPTEATSLMKIIFHSDYSVNKTGFKAIVIAVCGGSVRATNGVIEVNNDTHKYNTQSPIYISYLVSCEWNISVRAGRKIKVEIDWINLPTDSRNFCAKKFILFKNGHSAESPLLGVGKYCGTTIPTIPETTGNNLYVKYSGFINTQGFKFRFSEVSMACGGRFTLTLDSNTTTINSPNFPEIPHPHTECTWVIMAPGGEKIQVDFEETFNFRITDDCNGEYVELKDGGTQMSSLIGRFCSSVPGTKTTTGNVLHVHFFTDVDDPYNGFKAKISIASCGGTIRSSTGNVKSPGYPRTYSKNLDCSWRIVGSSSHFINLEIFDVDFSSRLSSCDTSAPHVNISDIISFNNSASLLGTYCSMFSGPTILRTTSNEAVVSFKSGSRSSEGFRGFSIGFNSTYETCGSEMNTPSGEISSSGSRTQCMWKITVPWGRRVTLELLDVDSSFSTDNAFLYFYNSIGYHNMITRLKDDMSKRIFHSTSNKMSVYLYSQSFHRFRARYTSDLPAACGGDLSPDGGMFQILSTSMNMSSYYCEWQQDSVSAPNQTLALTIINATLGYAFHYACIYQDSKIDVTADGDSILLASLCNNYTEPHTILSPFSSTVVVVSQSSWSGPVNATVQYASFPCGGILVGPEEIVSSPGYPGQYPPNVHCAWSVSFEEEQAINITFLSMNLETSCLHDYLVIHNGPLPSSPIIKKICGTTIPQSIKSESNQLWIEFHSNSAEQGTGFSLKLSSAESGCGGVFHKVGHFITSPNFPSAYPANAECEWDIRADIGYTISLNFIERFNLEYTVGCTNDYIQVFDFVGEEYVLLQKVCGRETPKPINSTSSRMKVIFRSNANISSDGFKAQWTLNCGGVISNVTKGQIISPGYPSDYGNNLNCNYTILMPQQYITAHFISFSLEQGYRNCRFDNLTIYGGHSYWSLDKQIGIYCGMTIPPNIITKNRLVLVFKTDYWVARSGFILQFQSGSCGGVITQPGSLVSPQHLHVEDDYADINCTWVITAPENQIIKLKFSTLYIDVYGQCYFDNSLVIYNGPSISTTKQLGMFCGNLTLSPPTVHSTGNVMTVAYHTYNYIRNNYFAADIAFTIGEAHGCGGVLNASKTSKTIRSPDIDSDGLYEASVECHWVIRVRDSQVVNLRFTSFDLKPCINVTANSSRYCSCDYVEVRDGASQYSELIGTYCGNTLPSSVVSSNNQIFIRFVSDGDLNGHGFVTEAFSENSACGTARFNVSDQRSVLMSPNYPADYPTNLHCRWLLTGRRYSNLDIHIEDMDIKGGGQQCTEAMLKIADTVVTPVITEGLGQNFIYYGQNTDRTSVRYGSSIPLTTTTFCGTRTSIDYFSSGGEVVVMFKSSSVVGRGFKITFSYAGCNRNYTAVQGRIKLDNIPENCIITIQAPENNTIALYFAESYLQSSINCENLGLEVLDGANADSPQLVKTCSYSLNPIFSTGRNLRLKLWNLGKQSYGSFDLTYTTTDQGPGCGGSLFNYGGSFTSALYPNNVRNATSCRWDVAVPVGTLATLKFTVFELGTRNTCETDYIELLDVDIDSGVETVRTRYCGGDDPAVFISMNNKLVVRYTTSVHNSGNGWVAYFMGKPPGTELYDTIYF